MKPRRHDGRILMVGFGAVGRCVDTSVELTPLDRWDEAVTGARVPPAEDTWQFSSFHARGQI
jgi:hypothetical protein